jgi:hypothetical protein
VLPELECQPTTRVVQADGRIDVAVHRRALAEVLGWSPGPLAHELDGRWVVLGEPEAGTRTRRGDRARLSGTSRIVLPAALRRLLGVSVGDKVLLLPLPSTRRLALTHPGCPRCGRPSPNGYLACTSDRRHCRHGAARRHHGPWYAEGHSARQQGERPVPHGEVRHPRPGPVLAGELVVQLPHFQ